MEKLLKLQADYFIDDQRKIPKHNFRSLSLETAEMNEDRTIQLSVSSSQPYRRYSWMEEYDEVLKHSADAVDLSRFNDSAMLLFNHDRDAYIGVIQKAWIDGEKLYNQIRFDCHDLAEKILTSVKSGILRNVSIGYSIMEMILKSEKDGIKTYEATKWMPFETSLVTIPADASVGVGRAYYSNQSAVNSKQLLIPDKGENLSKNKSVPSSGEQNISKKQMSVETLDKNEIIKSERERTESLLAAGKKYNCPELAQQAIKDGTSLVDFRSLVLDHKPKQNPVAVGIEPVGMSNKERKDYRVLRAIGYACGHLKADQCGLELEVSKEIQKRNGKPPKGIYIDQSELVSYRAPYETGVPAAAGNLIETELLSERFIDQLYNMAAFLSMGVTYLRDLTGNIEIPRESSYTTGYWVGEKQTIPEGEGTFDKITMSPKKLAVITKMTFEMIEQSSIDLESYARNRLLRGLALELDRAIGFGTGIGSQPLGIASHPETKSVVLGTNGGALDYPALIAMQTELFSNNAMGNFGYVVNARTKGKLQTTLDQNTGGGRWIWQNANGNDGTIAGYMAHCSNQIPNDLTKGTASNLTAAFFGDFSQVLLGLWSGMDILANPYSEFSEAIIQVRAMQLCDLQLTRGDYFCVATDVQNN